MILKLDRKKKYTYSSSGAYEMTWRFALWFGVSVAIHLRRTSAGLDNST